MAPSSLLQSIGKETYTANIIWAECDKYSERSIKIIMRGQGEMYFYLYQESLSSFSVWIGSWKIKG